MTGVALPAWVSILWRWRSAIEWRTYFVRICFLTLMALINTIFSILDWIFFARVIARAAIHKRPVFVLGHPRTGTTLLHNLLSQDDVQFFFCSTFQAGFPHGFGCLNSISWMFSGVIDSTRPMDNMKLSLDLPQEDELATNLLSYGRSQYMSIYLMRQASTPTLKSYVSFDDASEEDTRLWCDAFRYLLRKLSAINDGGSGRRRLLLKSPVHTGRVKLLLKLFPEAQFIYLHRDPYRVYQSAANMADKAYPYMYLNTPDNLEIQEFILSQFMQLHRLYIRDRTLIPKANLLELPFKTLTSDPIKAVENIYTHFGWPGFSELAPKLETFQAENKSYKKNAFVPLSSAEKKMIARRWREAFQEFGYPIEGDLKGGSR